MSINGHKQRAQQQKANRIIAVLAKASPRGVTVALLDRMCERDWENATKLAAVPAASDETRALVRETVELLEEVERAK